MTTLPARCATWHVTIRRGTRLSMTRRLSRLLTFALLAETLPIGSHAQQPAQRTAPEQAGALPYDLAFSMLQLEGTITVTRDGRRIAYAVIDVPEDANRDSRFLPNGSPSSVTGATALHITDRQSGESRNVCPGGNCWRPSWSPDGRMLSFFSDRDGPPQLWLHDLATGDTRKLSDARVKAKLWAGDEAQWSPDGSTLYVPLAPATGHGAWLPDPTAPSSRGPAPRTDANAPTVTVYRGGTEALPPAQTTNTAQATEDPSQVFMWRENNADMAAIDVRTGRVRVLLPAEHAVRPSVLRLSASGLWLTSLSAFKRESATTQVTTLDLALVSTAGGEVHTIVEDLPTLADYHYLNYSWHPTRDQLVYIRDDALWLVDVGARGPSAPRRLGAELGALAPTVNWFTRDGQGVVVGVNRIDDRAYADARAGGLAVIPLDGGTPKRVAFPAEWIFRDVVKEDARTVWQPDGRSVTILARHANTGETGLVRFDLESGASTVVWQGMAWVRQLRPVVLTGELIAIYEDVGTPADVYTFAADLKTRARVSSTDPRLDRVSTPAAEIFETMVPLHDGTLAAVRTAVILPNGAKRGDRLPAIVSIYPGGDQSTRAERFGGGDVSTVPALVFTSRGYAVLHVHLRLGPNREAGNPLEEMVDVLLPQVYHAAELGYIDIERVAITGQSFGGYGTASIISGTNLFRAAVAVSGIYDLAGTYGHMAEDGSNFWIGWSEAGQARMGTHPWANMPRYLENSPYYRADRIRTPLLIVHGDTDNAYHDGVKLFSALKRLERPVQLAAYHGEGHVIWNWRRRNAADAAQRMVEFYEKHIGRVAASSASTSSGVRR
ncbi:MAG: prolyl oligopeptidase family serine peptidase [Gemmatimonadetes bacterium]|nr:prolyl oligopeptidase family serine peptidase [Gemmatimonadota bacterium]